MSPEKAQRRQALPRFWEGFFFAPLREPISSADIWLRTELPQMMIAVFVSSDAPFAPA